MERNGLHILQILVPIFCRLLALFVVVSWLHLTVDRLAYGKLYHGISLIRLLVVSVSASILGCCALSSCNVRFIFILFRIETALYHLF